MPNLTNINFMTQTKFDEITETNDNELYFVEGSGLDFPSDQYIDLSLAASGSTYTAPANGYFAFSGYATASDGWCNMYANDENGNVVYAITTVGPNANHGTAGFIPIVKDRIISLSWNNYSINFFRFIYAQGEI